MQEEMQVLGPEDDQARDIDGAVLQTEVVRVESHVLEPGEHELVFLVAADNAKARRVALEVNIPQRWSADRDRLVASMKVGKVYDA